MNEIRKLYKSASANLYVIGIILFSLIWLNIETFFAVMTNGEDLVMFKTVFLLLALTKIIDMVTSINFSIISYSRSEEHTSELQSRPHLVCRLLLEKKKNTIYI